MEKTNDIMKSFETSKTECDPIKSKATIKYSSVFRPASIAHLPCNTDLNLPPSNWLSNTAESYGLRYTLISQSDDFTSFQLAHMFPDHIGKVDVVSDAENIKQLLKIPYSNKSVSMVVHQIENTLLIDEFDIHKHLIVQKDGDWKLLRNFFYNHILESFDKKEKCVTHKVKTLDVIQQKILNSKFLHHSIADLSNSASNNKYPITISHDRPTLSAPSLPEPLPEEKFPGNPMTHQLFNQNVLWNFNDLRMMLGTDLPIFGGDTSTCFSLRLRDVSKPMGMLTCIDYWLDNLMCNIPEIVMCNHLNGIVQKYEQVKTEDLPHLNNSKFSSEVIRDVAQNILSFLKANTTKAGHTYWLFKGDNDDVIKLYDLTTLCSESLVKEQCNGQNPFTVPVAMLMYCVARNLIYNLDKKTSSPSTVQNLLNNCLKLLNKTKYPQIVTSAYFMLSDLYIPWNFTPFIANRDEMSNVSKYCITLNVNSDDGSLVCSNKDKHIYSVDVHNLCLSYKEKNSSKKSTYSSSKNVVYTLKKRCQKALYYIGCGLECLQYFKNLNPQLKNEEKLKKIEGELGRASSEVVQMSYLISDTDDNNTKKAKITKGSLKVQNVKKKNHSKCNKKNINAENCNDSSNVFSSPKFMSMAETMSTWHYPPDDKDDVLWKIHLSVLFYEKASLSYFAIAFFELECKKYGEALKHYRSVFECRRCLVNTSAYDSLLGLILAHCADCCLLIAQRWEDSQQYTNELESNKEYEYGVQEALLGECNKYTINDFALIPSCLSSKADLIKSAEMCYKRALNLELELELELNRSYKTIWNRRLSIAYIEIISCFTEEIEISYRGKNELDPSRLQWLIIQSEHYFSMGMDNYKINSDINTLAMLYANIGRFNSYIVYYSIIFMHYRKFVKDRDFFNKAVENFNKSFEILGNRRFNFKVWDMVQWDLSSVFLNMAALFQNDPLAFSDRDEHQRKVVSLFLKSLKYCDLDNDSCRRNSYEFRIAFIHEQLASLYYDRLRYLGVNNPKFKTNLNQCMSHYCSAFEMYSKINNVHESIEVLIKRIMLDELQFEYATNDQSKMKCVMSFVEILGKCVETLKMLESSSENFKEESHMFNNNGNNTIVRNSEGKKGESKFPKLIAKLEKRVLCILKCMIKLAISKRSKLTNKTDKLKTIYGDLLKKSNVENDYINLLAVMTQITELGL